MKEIEVKMLEIDVADVERRLKTIGAKKTFEGDVKVIFYDFPNGRLDKQKKRLRLRDFGARVELTYKHKLKSGKAKIAEEHQVNLSDFETAQKILESIGMVEIKSYLKHRISYKKGQVCFEIDTLQGCPSFMEIEASTCKEVFAWVKKLGFKEKDTKSWTGTKVMEYYQKVSSK